MILESEFITKIFVVSSLILLVNIFTLIGIGLFGSTLYSVLITALCKEVSHKRKEHTKKVIRSLK